MSVEKTKVLWASDAAGNPGYQRVVVARYFLGIEIGRDNLGNRTDEILELNQMVFSDGYNVVGIVSK